MEKESFRENLDLLRSARVATLKVIAHLTQEQLNFRPGPGKWSIGEISDHLIIVERFWGDRLAELVELERAGRGSRLYVGLSALELGLPFIPRLFVPFLQLPLRMFNMFVPEKLRDLAMEMRPVALEAPAVFLPTHGRSSAELTNDLQVVLRETAALFESNLDLDFDSMTAEHPFLGKAPAAKEPEILALHERRHQNQMREIMNLPGFPSG